MTQTFYPRIQTNFKQSLRMSWYVFKLWLPKFFLIEICTTPFLSQTIFNISFVLCHVAFCHCDTVSYKTFKCFPSVTLLLHMILSPPDTISSLTAPCSVTELPKLPPCEFSTGMYIFQQQQNQIDAPVIFPLGTSRFLRVHNRVLTAQGRTYHSYYC